MNEFKNFGIKPPAAAAFIGDKVKISRILNKQITVHDFKIAPSKQNKGDCLHLQIAYEGKKHVVFTGSTYLMEMIKKVPKDNFPFTTTIEEINDSYQFT